MTTEWLVQGCMPGFEVLPTNGSARQEDCQLGRPKAERRGGGGTSSDEPPIDMLATHTARVTKSTSTAAPCSLQGEH